MDSQEKVPKLNPCVCGGTGIYQYDLKDGVVAVRVGCVKCKTKTAWYANEEHVSAIWNQNCGSQSSADSNERK